MRTSGFKFTELLVLSTSTCDVGVTIVSVAAVDSFLWMSAAFSALSNSQRIRGIVQRSVMKMSILGSVLSGGFVGCDSLSAQAPS